MEKSTLSETKSSELQVGKFGYFDLPTREFVITNPFTPKPWVNYLTNGNYAALVSHTGGGFSFYRSARDHRITRWRYNSLPQDRPGRYLYVRDQHTGQYWSVTWQPTTHPLQHYQCRHGFGYTTIETQAHSLFSSVTFWVPLDDDLELWLVRLHNRSSEPRQLSLFTFVELCLGHALVDLMNQPNDQHFNEVDFKVEKGVLFATKRYWTNFSSPTVKQANQAWDFWAFMGWGLPTVGFDGSRDRFIGPWRSEANPQAVESGLSADSRITSGDAIASLASTITLAPDEQLEFPVVLGIVSKQPDYQEQAAKLVKEYCCPETLSQSFEALKAFGDDYLSHLSISSPDPEMEVMINSWNQIQNRMTFHFARDASYYHGGVLFGRGYRDACQDLWGPLIPRPEWARERILELLQMQFADGSTFHLYYPLGGGERTGHSDTPAWLPFAVINYLKETGEFSLLEQMIPFQDRGQAPVLEHLERAIAYSLEQLSPQGLALFLNGDWNDTLDYCGRQGKGESIWLSEFLCFVLREMAALFRFLKQPDKEAHYVSRYEKLKTAINTHAWDGEYFLRGTNDWGEKIGSQHAAEGKIFLNAQSWAVISGVAEGERARQCMDAVARYLATPKGPKILHPAFTQVNDRIGLATRCVPGKKENGAVFNHTVAWAILAELINRNPDQAYLYYRQALPMNPVVTPERYEVEPYVYAEYVTSPEHPTFGQASHSWLTGSAVWMLRTITDHLFGVRPGWEGLVIDPCLPQDLKEVEMRRRFRQTDYRISLRNPQGLKGGKLRVTLDGMSWPQALLPALSDGKTHRVEVCIESGDT